MATPSEVVTDVPVLANVVSAFSTTQPAFIMVPGQVEPKCSDCLNHMVISNSQHPQTWNCACGHVCNPRNTFSSALNGASNTDSANKSNENTDTTEEKAQEETSSSSSPSEPQLTDSKSDNSQPTALSQSEANAAQAEEPSSPGSKPSDDNTNASSETATETQRWRCDACDVNVCFTCVPRPPSLTVEALSQQLKEQKEMFLLEIESQRDLLSRYKDTMKKQEKEVIDLEQTCEQLRSAEVSPNNPY